MRLKKILGCVLSLGLLLSPISVHAEVEQDAGYVAYAIEGNRVFTSIEEAWNMAKQGRYEVYLNKDWNIDWRLIMYSGDNATLNLNGHSITRQLSDAIDDGEVIYMNENSSLTLNGGEDRTFSVKNYHNDYSEHTTDRADVTTGGIITGGMCSNGAGGIHMKANCTLTLNHVGIVGNYSGESLSSYGGGIKMDGDACTVDLNDGAMISYNFSSNGGGIYVDGQEAHIKMNASEISHNYGYYNGGGIFSNDDATYIDIDNHSTINDNVALDGGGIFFFNSYSHINSSDSTGKICSNLAGGNPSVQEPKGGGIYYNTVTLKRNTATITNITLEDNTADQSVSGMGGAIYSDLAYVEITNCKIIKNYADKGAGLYINDKGNTLKDCTIKDNSVNTNGGGIYLDSCYDVNLSGKMTVKDNKNKDGNATNIYLENGKLTRAYVSGTPDSGSEVGLTGDGDCKVGINQSSNNGSFFVDNPSSYHLQYDDDKLYQKNGATGSIFAGGNIGAACVVIVGVALIGFVVYKKKKAE